MIDDLGYAPSVLKLYGKQRSYTFRVAGGDDCQHPGQVERAVTKKELLLRSDWLTLRRMDDDAGNIEIWRARPEEADWAFCLVEEYFEVAGVVLREDRGKFIEEYFVVEQGLWLARITT